MTRLPSAVAIAVCRKCGGHFTEKQDLGLFSKAPLGRVWRYECDKCGREVTSAASLQELNAAYADMMGIA